MKSYIALLAVLLLNSCGGDGGGVTTPSTGSLEIRTTTTGESEGYTVTLDGGTPEPIGPNATLTKSDLVPGPHAVELTSLPDGCTVAGENPRTVSIEAASTSTLVFEVNCTTPGPATGSVQVTTATTGANLDPDGYTFLIDNGTPVAIGVNASATVTDLTAASHTVSLGGIAENCAVQGENPRTVQVQAGTTATISFELTCGPSPAGSPPIAFQSVGIGLQAIFVVNPDGTGLTNLTPAGVSESGPVWSPDGTRILFAKDGDLFTMNGDGTGRVPVTTAESALQYKWSPDGRTIAFVDSRRVGADFLDELWVVQADGSGKRKLTDGGTSPTWGPDGNLAYVLDHAIHIINANGTGDRRLTPEGSQAFQPAWSPDGGRIAFVTLPDKQMFLINPDGSGLLNLTQGGSDDDSPTWSPDGSRLAIATAPLGPSLNSDIAVINRDGTARTVLTQTPWFDISPAWSPDGQRIVFASGENDSEIFVMNADGTAQTNISNRPETEETEPDWSRGQGNSQSLRFGITEKRRLKNWHTSTSR